MKKFVGICLDWIRKIFTPKSKFSAALTITLVASFCLLMNLVRQM